MACPDKEPVLIDLAASPDSAVVEHIQQTSPEHLGSLYRDLLRLRPNDASRLWLLAFSASDASDT
jgi:hypothetical protein